MAASSSASKKTSFPLNSSPPPPSPGEPTCRKQPISSLLGGKMLLKASVFRGLGCQSVAEVLSPEAVVRASADWHGKSVKKKKARRKKQGSAGSGVVAPDVWCTPGVGSAADVDCVLARRSGGKFSDRRRIDSELAAGENCSNSGGVNHGEKFSVDQNFSETFYPEVELNLRERSSGALGEIMMFQNLLARFDKYRDLRIDVDNMTYEELLQLGDKIGYVSTGLKKKEIMSCLKKTKHSKNSLSSSMEIKCSICQEEYEVNEDVRKLRCGHGYHLNCIKEWLSQKKTCPVCKIVVTKS